MQLNKEDGRKGSQVKLIWEPQEIQAFQSMKSALVEGLQLCHVNPDKPFILRTDASKVAIGAVLEQEHEGKLQPVSFFSRVLTPNQRNWSPREQETYAIIAALKKWAGYIGFQPVIILTDHKALEHWVKEYVDTPSGPAGRRGRWHEVLSKFDIEVRYVPGKTNIIADAMSRYAYPASKALQDCSWHGSAEDANAMKK